MQFLALVAAAGTFVAPALAQQAIVNNMCAETVYVQSWPFENGSPGPLTTLTTGQQFSENLRPVGSVSTPQIHLTHTCLLPFLGADIAMHTPGDQARP